MVDVVIHTAIRDATAAERARGLKVGNQVETAEWLAAGFARHGIAAEITADRHAPGEVHVVQGPHYCFDYWRERSDTHRVLWLNRCFYGDERFDLSLGWLRPDGSRDFLIDGVADGKGRLPTLKAKKEARRCAVVFADFGRLVDLSPARLRFPKVLFRPHPRDPNQYPGALKCPLEQIWSLADVAIGHSSTVLVAAKINGLHVESTDPLHIVHHPGTREQWLRELSWAQWSHEELISGAFWDHLKTGMDECESETYATASR